MDQTAGVEVGQGADHASDDPIQRWEIDGSGEMLLDRLPLDELHREEGKAAARLIGDLDRAEVVHRHQVRVEELGHREEFVLEMAQRLRIERRLREDLQSEDLAGGEVSDPVDGPHASPADFSEDAVSILQHLRDHGQEKYDLLLQLATRNGGPIHFPRHLPRGLGSPTWLNWLNSQTLHRFSVI